jgi:hypothetical protein
VNFLNANISDQYPGLVPQRNKYIANVGPFKLTGGIVSSPIPNWNYIFSGTENVNFSSATPLNYNPVSLGKDICTSSTLLPLAETREVAAGDVVRNTKTYSANANEFKHWDKKHAYLHLHTNPAELSLGLPTDTEFQDFYSQEQDSSTGKLQTIYDFIEAEDLSNANLTNTNLLPEDAQESNSKTVNQVWLKVIAGDTLNSSDTSALTTIAWTDPFLGGEAVYSARVILDIDPSLSGITRSFENLNATNTLDELNFSLGINAYPNPASDILTIEIDEIENVISQLIIIDGLGRKIYESKAEYINQIDVKSFNSGIYVAFVKAEGTTLNRIKFTIQH